MDKLEKEPIVFFGARSHELSGKQESKILVFRGEASELDEGAEKDSNADIELAIRQLRASLMRAAFDVAGPIRITIQNCETMVAWQIVGSGILSTREIQLLRENDVGPWEFAKVIAKPESRELILTFEYKNNFIDIILTGPKSSKWIAGSSKSPGEKVSLQEFNDAEEMNGYLIGLGIPALRKIPRILHILEHQYKNTFPAKNPESPQPPEDPREPEENSPANIIEFRDLKPK